MVNKHNERFESESNLESNFDSSLDEITQFEE